MRGIQQQIESQIKTIKNCIYSICISKAVHDTIWVKGQSHTVCEELVDTCIKLGADEEHMWEWFEQTHNKAVSDAQREIGKGQTSEF